MPSVQGYRRRSLKLVAGMDVPAERLWDVSRRPSCTKTVARRPGAAYTPGSATCSQVGAACRGWLHGAAPHFVSCWRGFACSASTLQAVPAGSGSMIDVQNLTKDYGAR